MTTEMEQKRTISGPATKRESNPHKGGRSLIRMVCTQTQDDGRRHPRRRALLMFTSFRDRSPPCLCC